MKDYDYILTVFREKSFSAAARKLYISQPALSMAVKKIENELGITIFDRASTPLAPTEEGKVYLEALEKITSLERAMQDRLSDMADLKSGHVTVSGENFVSSFILPEVLMRFSSQYRGIDVELVESNSPDLRKLLLSDSIDLLVAHGFDHTLYDARELFQEQVLLAVPESLPINRELSSFAMTSSDIAAGLHRTFPVADLSFFRNQAFLIMKPGNDMCQRAFSLCHEAGFQPNIRIQLDQMITAYNLACAGMGLAFVSDILIQKANGSGCLYYRLSGQFAERKMYIGWKKGRYISRAVSAFIETAQEVYRRLPNQIRTES